MPLMEGSSEEARPDGKVEVSEEQMIDVAQRCLGAIAEKMLGSGTNVHRLFDAATFLKEIDGNQVQLVNSEEFVKGIQRLGIHDFRDIEFACLIRLLALDNTDKYVMVGNLAQILEDYGVAAESDPGKKVEEEAKSPEKKTLIDFSGLDPISMVLLLGLAEYLAKEKQSLHGLFGERVHKQLVKTKKAQRTVELIKSADFFATLHDIGIRTDEPEHENLKLFLCINPSYPSKIYVKKLRKVLDEFAGNEELRAQAQKYYRDLVEEGEEENGNSDNKAEQNDAAVEEKEEVSRPLPMSEPQERAALDEEVDKIRVVEEIEARDKPQKEHADSQGRNDVIIDQDTANKVLI